MEIIGHGGKEIVERVLPKDAAIKRVAELKAAKVKTLDVRLADGNRNSLILLTDSSHPLKGL